MASRAGMHFPFRLGENRDRIVLPASRRSARPFVRLRMLKPIIEIAQEVSG